MKKIFSTILVLFIVTTTIGQDLSKKIAANAEAVVAIKTGNLTSLMSIEELNSNTLIQMMLQGMSKGGNKYSSLNDFGIDLSKTAYYAYEVDEKASYHCLSVPIANVSAFEKLTSSFGETQKIKGINAKINNYDKSILAWNKNSLFFVTSDLVAGNDSYEAKKAKKLTLNTKRVSKAFGKTKALKTPSYLTAINDSNAEAVVWIKDVNGLYGNYFKEIYGKFGGMTNMAGMLDMQKLYGKSEMVLKLFLENDQMRISSSMSVDDRWKNMYANMFNAKVNPKFYNYVNSKDVLGYVGYAVNTEAILNEYPKLLQTILSGVPQAKEYKEEAALIGDFFSLLLDEKAVGDLINGDMLVVLSDIETKDVSYKSYTYDDDYNRKEVTKTKKQTVPEFISMFSTKNEALFNKLLHVAQKRTALKANNGYYMVESNNDIPINLYVTVKDGIVFATSSEKGIQKIMKGSKKSRLSAKQQATISENNMSFYFNAKALMTKVPKDEISNSELEMFNYVKDNVEDMVIKVRQGNDGKFLSDFIINIPKSSKNALEYFLSFAEKAAMMM